MDTSKKMLFHFTVLFVVFLSILFFLFSVKKTKNEQRRLSGQIVDSAVFLSKTLQQ